MDNKEFETALKDFESNIQKRLPSMINIMLANKGNREQETNFNHFVDTLKRQRQMLNKELSKVAKPAQKIRFFNIVYNMDSQLRSMTNRDSFQAHMKHRKHNFEAPLVYDIGKGPESGELLNVFDEGMLLKTTEKVKIDQEVRVVVGDKTAKGKAMWSIPIENGAVETGVKLIDIPEDLAKEINQFLKNKE